MKACITSVWRFSSDACRGGKEAIPEGCGRQECQLSCMDGLRMMLVANSPPGSGEEVSFGLHCRLFAHMYSGAARVAVGYLQEPLN